ncbi:GrpB family protein [Paenibacillus herberti]|uniref:GrpB family protein n=1 Tax=Paenibacillus herberti TaxID=1619309 RepID=UPI002481B535|nr:GrpB family protein [Paenibacillus herberti]
MQPWTPDWAQRYRQEEAQLSILLGADIIAIHHIGSTSVPAIGYAKPIIDLLAVVRELEAVERHDAALAEFGYEAKGENGIPGRRFYSKGGEVRSHHLHVFKEGAREIDLHLHFKHYLSAHPERACAYGELKLELMRRWPDDRKLYQEGKQPFVNELVQEAEAWAATERNNKDGGMLS